MAGSISLGMTCILVLRLSFCKTQRNNGVILLFWKRNGFINFVLLLLHYFTKKKKKKKHDAMKFEKIQFSLYISKFQKPYIHFF